MHRVLPYRWTLKFDKNVERIDFDRHRVDWLLTDLNHCVLPYRSLAGLDLERLWARNR